MTIHDDVKRNEQNMSRDIRAYRRSAMKKKVSSSVTGNPPSSSSVQYIERRISKDGDEEVRLCEPGFRPTDADDPRYCTLRQYTIMLLSEIAAENL